MPKFPPSPLHREPSRQARILAAQVKQCRQEEWKAKCSCCKHCNAFKMVLFFFFFWNFLKFSEAFAAPQSQPPDSNWVMEITSDRSLPEQKMWGPECPKNHQASPHCQWRWSRGRYWTLILLPRCICKVHRCPHNPPVCSGNTLSKKEKKKCKSAQKLLLPSWKLKEIMASKWGRNLQRRIWAFAWQGKVLQKVSVA